MKNKIRTCAICGVVIKKWKYCNKHYEGIYKMRHLQANRIFQSKKRGMQ